jgi:hypothetical protein
MKQDCPLCELEAETTCHIFWSSPSTRDVWGAGNKSFQKSSFTRMTFFQVVTKMWQKCDLCEFMLFIGIARRIWLRRNEFIRRWAWPLGSRNPQSPGACVRRRASPTGAAWILQMQRPWRLAWEPNYV